MLIVKRQRKRGKEKIKKAFSIEGDRKCGRKNDEVGESERVSEDREGGSVVLSGPGTGQRCWHRSRFNSCKDFLL